MAVQTALAICGFEGDRYSAATVGMSGGDALSAAPGQASDDAGILKRGLYLLFGLGRKVEQRRADDGIIDNAASA